MYRPLIGLEQMRRQLPMWDDPFIHEAMRAAIPFRVDDVAAWVYDLGMARGRLPEQGTPAAAWATASVPGVKAMPLPEMLAALPTVAPVVPAMWCEYAPVHALSRADARSQGCLLTIAVDAVRYPAGIAAFRTWTGMEVPPDVRWVLVAETWMVPHDDTRTGIWLGDWLVFLCIDAAGRVVRMAQAANPRVRGARSVFAPVLEEEITVAMATLGFLHCKNIAVADTAPPRQMRRAAERASTPLITYKTLDIRPMARVLREEGGQDQHGIARALHICRGYFAHYTDEKPLFGKYPGTFYVPMHVRGKAKNGVVVKDYHIAEVGQ